MRRALAGVLPAVTKCLKGHDDARVETPDRLEVSYWGDERGALAHGGPHNDATPRECIEAAFDGVQLCLAESGPCSLELAIEIDIPR